MLLLWALPPTLQRPQFQKVQRPRLPRTAMGQSSRDAVGLGLRVQGLGLLGFRVSRFRFRVFGGLGVGV